MLEEFDCVEFADDLNDETDGALEKEIRGEMNDLAPVCNSKVENSSMEVQGGDDSVMMVKSSNFLTK